MPCKANFPCECMIENYAFHVGFQRHWLTRMKSEGYKIRACFECVPFGSGMSPVKLRVVGKPEVMSRGRQMATTGLMRIVVTS